MQSKHTLHFVCIYYFLGKQRGALCFFRRSPNVFMALFFTCGNDCGCFHIELGLLKPHTCPSEVNLADIMLVALLLCFRQASSDVSVQIFHSVSGFGLQMRKF